MQARSQPHQAQPHLQLPRHSSDTSHNFLPLAEPKQPTSQGSRDHVCTDQQWEHKPCSPSQWSSHCSKGIRPVWSPQSTSPTTSSNATQSTCKDTTASKVTASKGTASKGTTSEGHPSVFNCSCISFWLPSSAWNSSPAAGDYKERQAQYMVFKRQVSSDIPPPSVPVEFLEAWSEAVRTRSRAAKNALFSKWCEAGGNWGLILGLQLTTAVYNIYI